MASLRLKVETRANVKNCEHDNDFFVNFKLIDNRLCNNFNTDVSSDVLESPVIMLMLQKQIFSYLFQC